VLKVETDKQIVLEWEGVPGHDTRVEMTFEPVGEDTIVSISETGWRENQKDLDHSYMNCQGWTQFLSALKAYTEYGINLRKGAYDGVYTNAGQSAKA
jgi:uncharacterized protein YndB with AHSA1/START domain